MASASEKLARVEAAITALEDGGASAYSIGSRSVSKLDLSELYKERRFLQTEVQRESGSGGFSKAVIGRSRR